MRMKIQPVIVEQTYEAPIQSVWKALTEKDAMQKWYFDFQEFRAEVGFEFRFWGGPAEDRQYLHLCQISEVVPYKKISYSWRYDGYQGDTLVSFELFEADNKTTLKLSHEVLEAFPEEVTDFNRSNFEEGWNWIIRKSLKEYLENK